MNKHFFLYPIVPITTILVTTAVHAAPSSVTDVQLNSIDDESLQLLIVSPNSAEIEVVKSFSGDKTVLIDLLQTQLKLLGQESLRWSNPSVGITEINVVQESPERIQVRIEGATTFPEVNIESTVEGLVFNLPNQKNLAETTTETPTETTPTEEATDPIELFVTATRTEENILNIPRSTTVIRREEIEQQSQLSNNLSDILGNLVPGFGPPSQSASNRAQSLRGRQPSVLIDGVPLSSNLSVFQDLRSISPDAVERVEVVRGPTSIYGAEARGGVINIITRKPTEETFTASTNLIIGPRISLSNFSQSFGAGIEQLFSGSVGNFDYLLNASYAGTGNIFDAKGDIIPVGRSQGLDNLETFNILAKAGVNITPDQRLQLTVNYLDDKQNPPTLPDPSVDRINGRVKSRPLNLDRALELDKLPGRENLTLNLNYSNNNFLSSELNFQAFFNESTVLTIPQDNRRTVFLSVSRSITKSQKYGARLGVNTPLATNLRLLWGADYSKESIEQPLDIFNPNVFDASGGTRFEKIDEAFFSPPYDLETLGLFSQLNWQASERLSLSGGLRFERFNMSVDDFNVLGSIDVRQLSAAAEEVTGGQVSFNDVVFNVGANYAVSDNVSVYANFAQGFSAPDFRRFLRFLPLFVNNLPARVSEDIQVTQPIIVDNYEIGIRGNWDKLQASLAGFFTYSELGQNERRSEDGSFLESSREPTRTYGIEATVDYQIDNNWQLGGNFTWVEGDSSPATVDSFVPLSTVDIQPIKIGLYAQNQTTPNWANRLQLLIVGSRNRAFENRINNNPIDRFPINSYVTLDWISRLQIGRGYLTLGVQNLLNSQYFPIDSQTQTRNQEYAAALGRTISLQYQFRW
jgi:iron complex outermembrane recepter protein